MCVWVFYVYVCVYVCLGVLFVCVYVCVIAYAFMSVLVCVRMSVYEDTIFQLKPDHNLSEFHREGTNISLTSIHGQIMYSQRNSRDNLTIMNGVGVIRSLKVTRSRQLLSENAVMKSGLT